MKKPPLCAGVFIASIGAFCFFQYLFPAQSRFTHHSAKIMPPPS
jgi:hypothetical protein